MSDVNSSLLAALNASRRRPQAAWIPGDHWDLLAAFLQEASPEGRASKSLQVIRSAPTPIDAKNLHFLLEIFQASESQVTSLVPSFRRHLSHSTYVYTMGLLWYLSSTSLQRDWHSFMRSQHASLAQYPDRWFVHLWGMASLLHDIGYPLELWCRCTTEYVRTNLLPTPVTGGSCQDNPCTIRTEVPHDLSMPVGLLSGPGKQDGVSLLTRRLAVTGAWPASAETLVPIMRKHITDIFASGIPDHGITGALTLVNLLGQDSFRVESDHFDAMLDAAAAIMVHNAHEFFWLKKVHGALPLKLGLHPLAYMLMACDRIQVWDRRAHMGEDEALSETVWLSFAESLTIFVPRSCHEQIRKSLDTVLDVQHSPRVQAV